MKNYILYIQIYQSRNYFRNDYRFRNFVFDVLCGLEVIASKLGHSFSEEVEMGANWKGELWRENPNPARKKCLILRNSDRGVKDMR